MPQALQVKNRKTADLIPYARNARKHSEIQISQIAASIKERWSFCAENDNYAAGESGTIYRVCREQKSKSGRTIRKYETIVLRGSVDRDGYATYRMMVGGKKMHAKGHRLVLSAFDRPEPNLCVNHKDGNKANNSLGNLEWATVAENNAHSISTGLLNPRVGGIKNAKVKRYDYAAIYIMNKHAGFSRSELAKMNNVSRSTIGNVINKTKKVLAEIYAKR